MTTPNGPWRFLRVPALELGKRRGARHLDDLAAREKARGRELQSSHAVQVVRLTPPQSSHRLAHTSGERAPPAPDWLREGGDSTVGPQLRGRSSCSVHTQTDQRAREGQRGPISGWMESMVRYEYLWSSYLYGCCPLETWTCMAIPKVRETKRSKLLPKRG